MPPEVQAALKTAEGMNVVRPTVNCLSPIFLELVAMGGYLPLS